MNYEFIEHIDAVNMFNNRMNYPKFHPHAEVVDILRVRFQNPHDGRHYLGHFFNRIKEECD